MLDTKLARGLMRGHVRRSLAQAGARERRATALVSDAVKRLLRGRPLSNPTGIAAGWRKSMAGLSGHIVDGGRYTRALALWPGWVEADLEYGIWVGDTEIEHVDDIHHEFAPMVEAIDIDRKALTAVAGGAPLSADQHVFHRWLERQHNAEIEDLEAALLSLVPVVAIAHTVIDAQHSVGMALPAGDGLLMGYVLHRFGEVEHAFGAWQRIAHGRQVVASAPLLGAPREKPGKPIASQICTIRTYLGVHEMDDGQRAVRQALLAWMAEHQAGIQAVLPALVDAALENRALELSLATAPAAEAFKSLLLSDLWRREVINRHSQHLGRRIQKS